ncbi:murein L,D-transpeptidase YafK [Rhodobium orientis]|uniref:L,D-transpeptidase family protein n=1 Tax=Rhodobium orientis TaxID=34017 RepID=UPI0016227519|nr:murein L,D-transpeptidase family protein [Rhodobium orientis]MBB4304899.1 murein L,D-transpeptidase YafK [Rhodobium orientis]
MVSTKMLRLLAAAATVLVLAACQPDQIGYGSNKHLQPLSAEMRGKINDLNMSLDSPILVRIFKEENTLEVWKQKRTGRFALLKTYKICAWSGKLGPKFKEGDRQAPEGFYEIYPAQMNPNSDYYLSFNLGFPNAYDRAHGRTGSHLMVHGACSSRGCYAMEDAQIAEIYSLARDAFRGGQRAFQVQALPFRMTPENLAKHHDDPNMDFWLMLKEGYDHFEIAHQPPKIDYCGQRYVFNAVSENDSLRFNARAACPDYTVPPHLATAVATKQKQDAAKTLEIVARLEDEARRKAEWEKRQKMLAEVLGAKKGSEGAAIAEAGAVDDGGPAPAGALVAAGGATQQADVPAPKPGSTMALRPERESGVGALFGGIFGDEDKPERDATTPDTQADAQDAGTETAKAGVPVPPAEVSSAGSGATGVPAAKPAAAAPQDKDDSVLPSWLRIGG